MLNKLIVIVTVIEKTITGITLTLTTYNSLELRNSSLFSRSTLGTKHIQGGPKNRTVLEVCNSRIC